MPKQLKRVFLLLAENGKKICNIMIGKKKEVARIPFHSKLLMARDALGAGMRLFFSQLSLTNYSLRISLFFLLFLLFYIYSCKHDSVCLIKKFTQRTAIHLHIHLVLHLLINHFIRLARIQCVTRIFFL